MTTKRILVTALTLITLGGLCAASPTQATVVTVHVVNAAGVPQAEAQIYDSTVGETLATTNGDGNASYPVNTDATDASLADAVSATRSADDQGDPCDTAPEGWPGIALSGFKHHFLMNEPVPVTLPVTPGQPFQPQLSNEELGMVGLINYQRALAHETPMTISSVLSASADKYLSDLPNRPLDYSADATYCFASGPGIRAVDAGFPTLDDVNESVLRGSTTAGAAINDLENDPHNDSISNSDATLIGIAQEGDTWVIDTSALPANDPFYSHAGDTGNTGNVSLVASEVNSKPHLQIRWLRLKKHKIKALVTLLSSANGAVSVTAVQKHKPHKHVSLTATRRGPTVNVSGTLPKRGAWTLQVSFTPKSLVAWKAVTINKQFKVR